MHKIKEKLMEELCEVEEKMKKAGSGKISAGDLEYIHKLTDSIKNIDKIEMLEDGDYSEAMGGYMDGGSSYARGRRGNVRRDSMGRYSRDDGMSYNDGMPYGGSSYARGGNRGGRGGSRGGRGGYSREDGYSYDDAKEHMIGKAEDMLEMAEDEKQKRAIHKFIKELEEA